MNETLAALKDIQELIKRKSRGKGGGYKVPEMDTFVRFHMEGTWTLLALYTDSWLATFKRWATSQITAKKLIAYLAQSGVIEKHGLTKKISIQTACQYLNALGFWFTHEKGQYSDGHEQEDVFCEQNTIFIPK